jgi:oleandomycin transport system permease protein
MVGGPVAEPVTWTIIWGVVIMAVFAPLSMLAFRKRV